MVGTPDTVRKNSLVVLLVTSACFLVLNHSGAAQSGKTKMVPGATGQTEKSRAKIPPQRDSDVPHGDEAKPDRPRNESGPQSWPGFGISFNFSRMMGGQKKPPDPAKILDKEGPQFPDVYNMSDFSIEAYAKGNWPMVIDFELEQQSDVLLTIAMEGVEPFYFHLNGNNLSRHQEKLVIPARFGETARPATYSIRGLSAVTGEVKPVYLRLFGIGAGNRAVGSLKIDQLRFQPGVIRPQQKERASYSFHSHEDFTKAEAEFWQVGRFPRGPIIPRRVDVEKIKNVVRRDELVSSYWLGKGQGKSVTGQFQIQVCAWVEGKDGGDWATALSPELVIVE